MAPAADQAIHLHHKEEQHVHRHFAHNGRPVTATVVFDVVVLAAGNKKRPRKTHELIEFNAPDGETRTALLRAGEFAHCSDTELAAIYEHAFFAKAA